MIYNNFKEIKLSSLGMGCMRFPTLENSDIDIKKTREMVAYAIKNGINYFDTAWGYHNGNSEPVIGEILADYPRESFYLATKFPGYDTANMEKAAEIFEEQLERCRVDYFDFYLFHNVCENNIDMYLDPKYGILDYLLEQKKQGRIRHLGFSAHANLENMKRFLDAYGEHMEFCQLQINWFDWSYQKAKEKVELVSAYGIPVWVMEPVRGGSLARLNEFYMSKLDAVRENVTPARWAFRFIQSIPEVTLTLSGMSDFEQLKENIEIFSVREPLSDAEKNTLFEIAAAMETEKILPCTSCKYCTAYCPKKLEIPRIIQLYNESVYSGNINIGELDEDKRPSACIGCRSCEEVCPQNIKISEMMKDFAMQS